MIASVPGLGTDPETRLLTTEEVAVALRCSSNTVRWMRRKGTGPRHILIGKRAMYREVDLRSWLAAEAEAA